MKKLLLILLVAFTIPASAQSWAAPGATWYYDFSFPTWVGPFNYGYERIQNIGDTIIISTEYNKLQIYREWYDWQIQSMDDYYVPQLEFTRIDSGVVYYYRDSADYVLYDFNAQPGDSWVLLNEFENTPCDTSSIVVDSIATVIINGDTLRVLRTSPVNWSGITFNYPRIIEKIGSLANLLPYTMCITDIPQGYNLRCYSDSSGWMYQNPNWPYACDDIMGNTELAQVKPFTVTPNLQANSIVLNGAGIVSGALVEIYDSRGQLIQQEIIQTQANAEFRFATTVGGIYFLRLISGGNVSTQSFFISGI